MIGSDMTDTRTTSGAVPVAQHDAAEIRRAQRQADRADFAAYKGAMHEARRGTFREWLDRGERALVFASLPFAGFEVWRTFPHPTAWTWATLLCCPFGVAITVFDVPLRLNRALLARMTTRRRSPPRR